MDTSPGLGRRIGAALLVGWCLLSPTGLVFAGPVADTNAAAAARPTVTTVGGGVPLVNITAPNAAGISYNRYARFDVDPVGLFLNNSRVASTTPLGDSIAANPNLGARSASVILNEVVSALPSQLNGPLAVIGDTAKVVIANPNGITCNGCGFINTSHVTLTTGTPLFLNTSGGVPTAFDSATALAFQVRGGRIEVTGQGLASPADRLDLIAETLSLTGNTNVAGTLNLLAGRQTVDHESLSILATDLSNNRAAIGSDWAIDASLLGAMTAGQIKIVSTAVGMGVRSSAQLGASAGDLNISAAGDISVRQLGASRDIGISSTGTLTNAGQIVATRNFGVTANTLRNQNGQLVAGGDGSLTVNSLDNRGGALQAGGNLSVSTVAQDLDIASATAGSLLGGSNLTVRARSLSNSGTFLNAGNLTLIGANSLSNAGLLITSGDLSLTVTAPGGTLQNSGTIQSLGRLTATADSATNAPTGILESGTTQTLNLGSFNNQGTVTGHQSLTLTANSFSNAGTLQAAAGLTLNGGSVSNTGPGILLAGGPLSLTLSALTNQGNVLSFGDLIASIGTLTNSGTLQAANDVTLNLGSASSNAGGTLAAGRDLGLTTTVPGNFGGSVGAGRDLALNFSDYTHGANETDFAAGRNLRVTANSLTNQGILAAPQDLSVTTTAALVNTGQLLSGRDMALSAGTSLTNATTVEAGRDLSLSAASFTNGQASPGTWSDGTWAGDTWYIWTQLGSNTAASLAAARNLNITTSAGVLNLGSILSAGGDLTLNALQFDNTSIALYKRHIHYTGMFGGHPLVPYDQATSYRAYDADYLSAYANTPSLTQGTDQVTIHAATQNNTGTIQGRSVYLGGNLTNGITDFRYQTPASTLPASVITLASRPATSDLLAHAQYTATGPYLFQSAGRLALFAPIGNSTLLNLLPANLRGDGSPFLMDSWLEQQAIRQAAIGETGRALFVSGLGYDDASGLSADSQQRLLLYQAAARFATDNNIALGVALSDAQRARLTAPILWYVEQEVDTPNGKTRALVPQIYLPDGYEQQMANIAGGVIRGQEVTLEAPDKIDNTGYVLASDRLDVNTTEFDNIKRNADIGTRVEAVPGGELYSSGDTVQPGGFVSAANLQLNASRVQSISGEFYQNGQEISAQLEAALGGNFAASETKDHIQTHFVARQEDSGFGGLFAMVVAVIVTIYTAGAASELLVEAASSEAFAAEMAVGANAMEAGAAADAAGLAAASSTSTLVTSSALGAMAGNASAQLITTGQINGGDLLKAGFAAGLTAGILNTPMIDTANGTQSLNQLANVQTTAGNVIGQFNADTFGQNLLGIAGRGLVNAGVNSSIYGGSFGEAFKSSLVSDLAAVGANAVGQQFAFERGAGNTGFEEGGLLHTLSQAGVGGVAQALQAQGDAGKAFLSGALGGGISALLGDSLKDSGLGNTAQVGLAAMVAGVSGQLIGLDGKAALNGAINELLNNTLSKKTAAVIDGARRCQGTDCFRSLDALIAEQKSISSDPVATTQDKIIIDQAVQLQIAYLQSAEFNQALMTQIGGATLGIGSTEARLRSVLGGGVTAAAIASLVVSGGCQGVVKCALILLPLADQLQSLTRQAVSGEGGTVGAQIVKVTFQQAGLALSNAQAEQAYGAMLVAGGTVALTAGGTGGSAPLTAEGTANAATYQQLKNQLTAESLASIAAQDSRLATAVRGSGSSNPNFSIGTGTATEANQLGQTWVGDGARFVSNQTACPGCLISADGTRIYRPPQAKTSSFATTGVQANFVQQTPTGAVISNGHLNVIP